MADALYINGRFTTTDERVLGVEDRGFQFGDAVYEVFKFLGKRPIFLREHFRRLEISLRTLEIAAAWADADAFAATIRELLARTAFDDGIVYIQVSRGEAERSHFWPDALTPTAVAYSRRFAFPDAAKKELGIRVITTRDLRWHGCHVKSVNLLANAIAKKEAQRAGATEALMLADGFVREGAGSNFFAVKNGHLVTHPLDEHILPGVVRDRVIDLALGAKIRVDERPLREAELFDLDEAFITSTTQGVMPVAEIDGRVIGNSRRGEVTTTLQQLFDALEAAS
ncbi:MAG: aminotransferase class IV [Acidobacteria bacterium]|nr:aminotransferase class IV [Acidobacteriota bacterium]MBV9476863.1 aminotransferase class IV [Acidobacteriota bacterium]